MNRCHWWEIKSYKITNPLKRDEINALKPQKKEIKVKIPGKILLVLSWSGKGLFLWHWDTTLENPRSLVGFKVY